MSQCWKFSICLRNKSKNEVDLSGKTKSSTVSKANKGRFRLQLLQLLLPTSRMTKKCYVLWTLVEKVFHCFGYMQRQRCSLTLCKAMYKTHGASTEYHHVCILSPGCFAIPTWENMKKPRKHPLFEKDNCSFRGKILPFPKNLPQNLGGFHQWRCPRLQVLPPPWHQVIGNFDSTTR